MFRHFLINLLFWLLGNTYTRQYNIPYLFGASTSSHASRKKKWENALAAAYKNKDLLDFLFYQAESDKENVFKGKIHADIARGARIRTLFIVYSMRQAAQVQRIGKVDGAEEKSTHQQELAGIQKAYKSSVDISK